MSRRILLVTYPWPPLPTVGTARWLAMVKYLRRLGHEVTVLTTSAFGRLHDDEAEGVVRTADLTASPAARGLLRLPPLPGPGLPQSADPAPRIVSGLVPPDPSVVAWAPAAVLAGSRLVRERGIECVITTSPQESAHLVGLAIAWRTAWIADFRDGWMFDRLRPVFPTRLQTAIDARLEATVVRRADRLIAATRPIAEDLARRYGVEAAHVPNAWDPDLDEEVARAEPPGLDANRVSLVHTGSLRMGQGRDPASLLRALRRLLDESPETADRLELVVASRDEAAEARLVAQHGVAAVVRLTGHLSRAEAVALQRRADVLLLLTSRRLSAATGKLAEYLAAARPILALAEANEAERVVRETRTGVTVPPDDEAAIVEALRQAASGKLVNSYAPRGLEAYRFPGPAEAVHIEVERALRTRAPG